MELKKKRKKDKSDNSFRLVHDGQRQPLKGPIRFHLTSSLSLAEM